MLTGNKLIGLLYLPESDKEIARMREVFNIPKPELGKKFKEDGYVSTVIDDFRVEVFFSDVCDFENPPLGSILFSQISYQFKTSLQLPMSLNMGMSYDEVKAVMGRREDFDNTFIEQKSGYFPEKMESNM